MRRPEPWRRGASLGWALLLGSLGACAGADSARSNLLAQDAAVAIDGSPQDLDSAAGDTQGAPPDATGPDDSGPHDSGPHDSGPDSGPDDALQDVPALPPDGTSGDLDDAPDGSPAPGDTLDDAAPWVDTADPPDGGPALHPARYPAGHVHSPLTPWVVQRLAAIRASNPALQDDVFMKVGASTSVSASNLKCLASTSLAGGAFAALEPTRVVFAAGDAGGSDPFSRSTLAAKVGVSTPWVTAGDPSPLEQEYLATQPRLAFVHYGTNDMQLGSTYEAALWPFGEALWALVDELSDWGVVPMMVTISRRLDSAAADAWVPTYNAVIAGLAQGRQLPLIDMALAYEPLPNHGLSSDGLHGSTAPGGACLFTPEGLQYGYNTRNLECLTALDRLRAALAGEALDPPGPTLEGEGTLDAPYVIDALPFSDLRSTADAPPSALDLYSGCASSADESGPERVYVYDAVVTTRVRALVLDQGDVDIDVHLLDETASEAGCLKRAHRLFDAELSPGTYYFALDSYVSGGTVHSGEYLFVLQQLP